MRMERKRGIYERAVVLKVMYGSELWVLSAKERKALEVFEMKGLRSMCGIRVSDRIRNERIREICRWERGLVVRSVQSILRWYGHVVRMDGERLVGRIMDSWAYGNRGRGRPKRRWMDGIREALRARDVEGDGRNLAMDREVWRALVYGGGVGGGF